MFLFWLARPGARARGVCRFTSNLTVAQLVERGTVNATAVIPRSMVRIRPVRFPLAEWPSGLRRWFKAPVSSEARVRISLQSLFWRRAHRRRRGLDPGSRLDGRDFRFPGTSTSSSEVAQRKRVGLITQRSEDRNLPSLPFASPCISCDALAEWLRRSPAK
jgi:hypothetical protein